MRIKSVIFLILLFTSQLRAVTPEINISSDTNNVLIGERVRLTLEFKGESGDKVTFPVIPGDTIGKIDIIEQGKIDTTLVGNELMLRRTLTVTSFDTGIVVMPELPFVYERQGYDTPLVANSREFIMYFATIEIDTAGEIKDIKGPIGVPLTLMEILTYVLIVVGVGLLITGIVILVRRIKRKPVEEVVEKYDPTIPADLEALQALKELENKKLWQSGRHKHYHSELTDIIRTYIHRVFGLNAHEMTSDEILHDIASKDISNEAFELLRKILNVADLTKFAKYIPADTENYDCMTMAVSFVNMTKSSIMLETSENGETKEANTDV